jgi:hypothetical protein
MKIKQLRNGNLKQMNWGFHQMEKMLLYKKEGGIM